MRLSKSFIYLFILLTMLLFAASLEAVSLHPDLVEKLKNEGTLQEHIESMKDARAKGVWSAVDKALSQRLALNAGPDTVKLVILLLEYEDNLASGGSSYGDSLYFHNLVFSEGVLEFGSMREYYLENSFNQLYIEGEVYGWFMMPQEYAYYVDGEKGFGTYPRNAQKMVEDAVHTADPSVDFSQFDVNHQNRLEGFIVVHAGPGYEITGDYDMIHSHAWRTTFPVLTNDIRSNPSQLNFTPGIKLSRLTAVIIITATSHHRPFPHTFGGVILII